MRDRRKAEERSRRGWAGRAPSPGRRFLSGALSLVMAFAFVPGAAFATGDAADGQPAAVEQQTVDNQQTAGTALEAQDAAVAAPAISPEAGSYTGAQEVTITAGEGATIYYTTDGSDPTAESTRYEAPFSLSESATVKAIAVVDGVSSEVASAAYDIDASAAVTVNDENLRKAIAANLGLEYTEGMTITESQMAQLKNFKAENAGIKDLTGLEKAVNLVTLDLSGNDFSGIHGLSENTFRFTDLESVDMSRCRITNSSNNSNMGYIWNMFKATKALKTMDFSENDMTGELGLSAGTSVNTDLTHLETVDLSGNDLAGFFFASTLKTPTLRKVDLTGNRVYPDENGGDWFSDCYKRGFDKYIFDDQKSLTQVAGFVHDCTGQNIYSLTWDLFTVDEENKVLDLGTIDAENVTVKLMGYASANTVTGKVTGDGQEKDVVPGDATTLPTSFGDSACATLNLSHGENTFDLMLKHVNGEKTTYTIKANCTYKAVTVPEAGENSAGVKDPVLQKAICSLLNASVYKDNPVDPSEHDITITDMEAVTGKLSNDAAHPVTDLSGLEYAKSLTMVELYTDYAGDLDLTGLQSATNIAIFGRMQSVNVTGLTNLRYLTLTSHDMKTVTGVETLSALNSVTIESDALESYAEVKLPTAITSITISLPKDGSLPDMTDCAAKLSSMGLYGDAGSIKWPELAFTKLKTVNLFFDHDTEITLPSFTSKWRQGVAYNIYPSDFSWDQYMLRQENNWEISSGIDISALKSNSRLSVVCGRSEIKGESDYLTQIQTKGTGIAFADSFGAAKCSRLIFSYRDQTAGGNTVSVPKTDQVPSLTELSVTGMPFAGEDDLARIGEIASLTKLTLYGVPDLELSGLDLSKTALTQLTVENLQSPELNADKLPASLQQMTLEMNKGLTFISGGWEKFTSLTNLSIGSSYVKEFPAEVVQGIPSLQYLNADANYYSEIAPDTFKNSNALIYVWLGACLPFAQSENGWELDPASDAGKAVAALKELRGDAVTVMISHGLPTYSGLADLTADGEVLERGIYQDKELYLHVDGSKESITLVPTAILKDTTITVNGKAYKSGDEITVDLPETQNNIQLACHNDYEDNYTTTKDVTVTLTVSKGDYLESFVPEEGKVYEVPYEMHKINDAEISMSNPYFTHRAQVRKVGDRFDVRLTINDPGSISEMQYPEGDVSVVADVVGGDGVHTKTYRCYTNTLDDRMTVTLRIVPMSNGYRDAYVKFDLAKVMDVTDSVEADRAELNAAIAKAEDIVSKVEESRNIYTKDSYQAMLDELEGAKAVAEMSTTSQSRIDAAAAALNAAIDGLVIDESRLADKTTLEEALADAKALGKGNHTDTNWQALQDAIADAQAVYDDVYASTKEANAAARSLNTAVTMFNSSGEASELDPANLEDGVYTAYVDMVNASNKDQKSMSDGAVTKPVTITVKDGKYFVTANFHGIYVTLGDATMFGYMKSLRYWDGEDYKDVTVDSCYDVVDGFNEAEGYKYPHQMTFPLVNKSAGDDADGYVHVQVFVPIMESISAGSGTQDALMRIDWTSLAEGDEAANEAVKAEAARNELGQAIADAKNIGNDKGTYTAASYRALQTAIAEAEKLVKGGTATAAELKAANAKVEAARKALVKAGKPSKPAAKKALPKGKTFVVSGVTYKVTDAAKRLVTATKVSTSKKSLTIGTARYKGSPAYRAGAYKVTALAKGAFEKAGKLARLTLGANVATIGQKAFAKAKRLKALTVKSKRLTEKSVKGCLKGSKVKTVKVPKAKRKAYRKIFTKKVAGRKVAVR